MIFWNKEFQENAIPEKYLKVFSFNFRDDLSEFLHKKKFAELLEKNQLQTPNTSLLSEVIPKIDSLSFPAFVKMCEGSGSKRTAYINNKEDLIKLDILDSEKDSFIMQEFIDGQEYTIDFFADKGRLINHAIRVRHEHQGVSLVGEIVYNNKISNLVAKICKKFSISGINNIQFIENISGELFITDFNLRPSGTLVMTINSGVDLLENLIEYHKKQPLSVFPKPKKIRMIRYLKEFYYE